MSAYKAVLAVLVAATASGCFMVSMPPKVPAVDQATLPPDTFLDLQIGSERERQHYTERSDVCSGGSGCVEIREHKSQIVNVTTATAVADGQPVTIGKVASNASPEFVADNEHLHAYTSHCKRGRIVMGLGGLGLTAAYFLLQAGYSNPRKPPYIIGGFAAGGGGLAVMGAGHYLLGGRDCHKAEELMAKWSPVYEDPNATTVKRDSAKMLATLVEKFNHDHKAARAHADEPKEDETPESPETEPGSE